MDFIYNNTRFKPNRQELRARQTKVEAVLWDKLRDRQILGLKFFRQYSVGPCVLDFYCPQIRLSIELDGAHHYRDKEQFVYDKERTEYLKENNIKVLRFLNGEVINKTDSILERIKDQSALTMCLVPSLKIREGQGEL